MKIPSTTLWNFGERGLQILISTETAKILDHISRVFGHGNQFSKLNLAIQWVVKLLKQPEIQMLGLKNSLALHHFKDHDAF